MSGTESTGVCVLPAVNGCFLALFKVRLMKRSLVFYFIFDFRYDEWIKADKIVRPANKNVPKIKHRKKIKVRRRRPVTFAPFVSRRESLTVLNFDRTKPRRSKTSWRG